MPFLKSSKESIYYEVHDGNTFSSSVDGIILMHSLGTDHRMWRYQTEEIKQYTNKVVLLDARGHGASTANTGITANDWAEDIKNLCDVLNMKKVILCGVSMGGIQALAFSVYYPDYVKGLILADTFAKITPNEVGNKINLTAGKAKEEGIKKYANTYLDQTLSESSSAVEIRHELYDAIANMNVENYRLSAEACFSADFEEELKEIDIPSLILIGEEDYKTPIEFATILRDELPNAMLLTIPNAKHLSNIDCPDRFNRLVTGFLKLL
ncbi:alpha/beta fold hydrolase [Alteribacillus sp. YIM 98480]|uniref:alpha/beta fold hydrolase n=1 Tax=Alteribacillus sp. YIM 98480 TaxID=2606599 RepID=UPI00131C1F73|nr:alpha/beta fold hydrolase [Alteribacillus sp. YIM 98480]